MPPGHRLLRLDTVDSTNAEARRRADMGEPGPLWIWSARQSKGRGRAGREWTSQVGNLFASLLIRLNCPLPVASQLALVAGIVTYETVAKLIAYEGRSALLLKWPNDVLLSEEKVAGMLLENVGNPSKPGTTVVIGTGINLAAYPENLPQPAISLDAYGLTVTPAQALQVLAATTHEWLQRWAEGATFPTIRRAWLDRAGPLGRPLVARINGEEIEGAYAGLDSEGALRLKTAAGEKHITAGDVFFASR
ncbi:biotin--[acetyl-CoA-carboxylase] ligase [Methyloceanibacter marginalis]|jgi:BirA family biotin operon repressor/biotin-[acetyl-CoA-carboxylase] ligase|nr:biotin--[acetyl-CoA-carboxylase] ligase [Methyloceanibacter marginalis]